MCACVRAQTRPTWHGVTQWHCGGAPKAPAWQRFMPTGVCWNPGCLVQPSCMGDKTPGPAADISMGSPPTTTTTTPPHPPLPHPSALSHAQSAFVPRSIVMLIAPPPVHKAEEEKGRKMLKVDCGQSRGREGRRDGGRGGRGGKKELEEKKTSQWETKRRRNIKEWLINDRVPLRESSQCGQRQKH